MGSVSNENCCKWFRLKEKIEKTAPQTIITAQMTSIGGEGQEAEGHERHASL